MPTNEVGVAPVAADALHHDNSNGWEREKSKGFDRLNQAPRKPTKSASSRVASASVCGNPGAKQESAAIIAIIACFSHAQIEPKSTLTLYMRTDHPHPSLFLPAFLVPDQDRAASQDQHGHSLTQHNQHPLNHRHKANLTSLPKAASVLVSSSYDIGG